MKGDGKRGTTLKKPRLIGVKWIKKFSVFI